MHNVTSCVCDVVSNSFNGSASVGASSVNVDFDNTCYAALHPSASVVGNTVVVTCDLLSLMTCHVDVCHAHRYVLLKSPSPECASAAMTSGVAMMSMLNLPLIVGASAAVCVKCSMIALTHHQQQGFVVLAVLLLVCACVWVRRRAASDVAVVDTRVPVALGGATVYDNNALQGHARNPTDYSGG